MDPAWPVISRIGKSGQRARTIGPSSPPFIPGMAKSMMTASNNPLCSLSSAVPPLASGTVLPPTTLVEYACDAELRAPDATPYGTAWALLK